MRELVAKTAAMRAAALQVARGIAQMIGATGRIPALGNVDQPILLVATSIGF